MPDDAILPPDWVRVPETSDGKGGYYWNTETDETSWVFPVAELLEEDMPEESVVADLSGTNLSTLATKYGRGDLLGRG